MRHEDEEKEIRFEKIETWDLLREVDLLVEHIPNWEKFEWDISSKQIFNPRKKTGYGPNLINPRKKKKK